MTVQGRCQRKAPFLQRNWIRGLKALQNVSAMGNIVSSPGAKDPHPARGDGTPPHKKRRISSPSRDIDHLIASPTTSDVRPSLRVEVLRISHKDSKKIKPYSGSVPPRDVLVAPAMCRVTLYDLSYGQPRVVTCGTQKCDLITFKNPVGPNRIARINLARPFFFPEEAMCLRRPDDLTHELSDLYQIMVELETPTGKNWPPLDLDELNAPTAQSSSPNAAPERWVLSSRYDQVFGRLKQPLHASMGYPAITTTTTYQTDYVMDVDLRWTGGFKALKRLEKGSMPSIIALDPDADPFTDGPRGTSPDEGVNGVNGVNGHVRDESPNEIDDELEGDQTPSRALRTRERNKVYNLKVLSDQAQGRERRRNARGPNAAAVEGRVTYVLPSDQPVCLDYFRCVTCGAYHESMPQLQLHFETFHPSYEYILETTGQGPQFQVSALHDSTTSPSKAFQLGRAIKPFTLETLAAGDHSWIASRVGSECNEDFLKSPTPKAARRLHSFSPTPKLPKLPLRRPAKSKPSKVLVPETRQPLYDPSSKALLKPGQELPRPIADDTWLIQKHRESISDFSDVEPAERDYIWEWDGYVLKEGLTSGAYFSRTWLGFVQSKASWLIAGEHRMAELGKHAALLRARSDLDDATIDDGFLFINKARARGCGTDESGCVDVLSTQSPKTSQIRKSVSGCGICQLPVRGPKQLVCSNKECEWRIYHSTCVAETATMPLLPRSQWLCNACIHG